MISKGVMVGVLMVGALTFVTGGASWAAEKKEGKQEALAISHTKEAIEKGKAGKADELRKHAETALKYAEKAEKKEHEAHVEEGIKHLKMGVEEAKKGNAVEGTKHAEEALRHLEAEEGKGKS